MPEFLVIKKQPSLISGEQPSLEFMIESETFLDACLLGISQTFPKGATQRETHGADGVYIPPPAGRFAAIATIESGPGRSIAPALIAAGCDPEVEAAKYASRIGRVVAKEQVDRLKDMVNSLCGMAKVTIEEFADSYLDGLKDWCESTWRDPEGLARSWHHDLFMTLAADARLPLAGLSVTTVPCMRAAIEGYWGEACEMVQAMVHEHNDVTVAAPHPTP